jgi:hypothetical protein
MISDGKTKCKGVNGKKLFSYINQTHCGRRVFADKEEESSSLIGPSERQETPLYVVYMARKH